jgi:hypothetical protein
MTIAISGTTGITLDGQFNSASSMGFKNRLINSAMVIDQRNSGASVTPTASAYTLDRWQATISASSKISVQQSSTAPTGFKNSLLVTSLAATTVGTTDFYLIQQKIEGFNIADLGWGAAGASTVTLSFWVRSSLTGTFGGSLGNSAFDRTYPFTYTISAANTFEYKTITIAGDTSGTWLSTNGTGIQLTIGLGSGATYSGTAGAWAATGYQTATGATQVVATNGATFYITGVQLEKGSTATSFDYRPYGTELQLCYRYFRKTLGTVNTEPTLYAWGSNAQVVGQSWIYPVPMRTSATVSTSGSLAIAGGGSPTITADANSYFLYVNNTNTVASVVSFQPNGSYQISFSAEL